MGRRDLLPYVWAATALLCLGALAFRPTAADRELQLLMLALALGAGSVGAALGWASLPLPGLLLLAWMAWSVVPLPMDWLQRLSPLRAEAVEAARAAGAEPWTSLAADPAAALRGAVMLGGLFALFAVARAAAAGSKRAGVALALGVVGAGLVQAAVGIEQYLSALSSGEGEAVARGFFVNRGQFAAFLLPALGLGAGLAAEAAPSLRRRPEWAAAAVGATVLLSAGLLTSMSRAALVAAGLVVLVFLARASRRTRMAGLALVGTLTAVALFSGAGDRVARRFERLAVDGGDPGRLLVWRDSAPPAVHYAVWGAGRGGFEAVFERRSPYFARKSVDHAHSDVLETWVELGAVGFALLWGAIGWAAWRVWSRSPAPLALGAFAGAAGPLLQSAVDLPLQSPAVAAGAACCLGLASGCGGPVAQVSGWRRVSFPLAAAALLGFLYVQGGPPTASAAFERAEGSWAAGEVDQARALYLETLGTQPRAAAAWLRLSEIARSRGELEQALALARRARSVEPFTLRTEWALADLELAAGDRAAALERLASVLEAAPDMRPAAFQTLWRGGTPLEEVESAIGAADGSAAGDYLAFLAHNGLDVELQQAYRRLVEERGLQPPQAEADYIARFLSRSGAQ